MLDFIQKTEYYNDVTYYVSGKKCLVRLYERIIYNGNRGKDCGNNSVLCAG